MHIYLAGPEVFLPQARAIGEAKKAICARHGAVGLYPLDNAVPPQARPADHAFAIYSANCALMDRADALIANMTPFRGLSMDAGTAFEMGYVASRCKLVLGYTNAGGESYLQRARTAGVTAAAGTLDEDGLDVEDFGLPDNLMLACAVRASGFEVLAQRRKPLRGVELYADLELFEECVKAAVSARR